MRSYRGGREGSTEKKNVRFEKNIDNYGRPLTFTKKKKKKKIAL